VQQEGHLVTNPPASLRLPAGGGMLVLGTSEQRNEIVRRFQS
jgi:hypothetical protein